VPDLASLSTGAAYALLAALVFCESGILLGFFLPGDTVLFAAGLLSVTTLSFPLLITLVLVAAISGDAVGYATGRKAGPSVFEQRQGRVLNPQTLEQARRFYSSYGPLAVVVARWIPWVRTFTPLLAGAAGCRTGASWPRTPSAPCPGESSCWCWAGSRPRPPGSGAAPGTSPPQSSRCRWLAATSSTGAQRVPAGRRSRPSGRAGSGQASGSSADPDRTIASLHG